ncbi:MAG: FliA/WhiG family RNA polymerase sigma factor [Armatimonadota bacterium]
MIACQELDTRLLWTRFKKSNDQVARQKLIENYAYLAKVGAERMHIPATPMFSQEDLYGHAVIGLIDAVEKFDPDMGRPFEAYGLLRIKGSILDALRAVDWLPRAVRQQETKLRQIMQRVEMTEGRHATDVELCAEMQISQDNLDDLFAAVNASALDSLDHILSEVEDLNTSSNISDNMEYNPAARAEDSQVKRILTRAIDELADNEKTVVALYYFEDMTLKEIGKVLGVSESRTCQLHTKAVLKLQTKLSSWLDVLFLAA